MCSSVETTRAINQAFRAALLLIGTNTGAESAVLEGIQSMSGASSPKETLLRETVRCALRYNAIPDRQSDDLAQLPAELQCVGLLPKTARQCFILRIFLGYDRESCSQLLHVSLEEIDRLLIVAVQGLASLEAAAIENIRPQFVGQV